MKRIPIAAPCILFVAAVLPAQDTARPASKLGGMSKPDVVSNEEANIPMYIELRRTDSKESKSEVWPIYKKFEAEYATLGNRIIFLVKSYTADAYENITDDVADQVLSIQQQRNILKKKYYDRVKDSLGAVTAARFLEVENQLERIVDLQIASKLPVTNER
jgi:hypothetical protein